MGVSENSGTPKLSILIGFSIINHPFGGTIIFGNIQIFFGLEVLPKTSIHHSSFSENDGKENPSKSPFVKCAGGAYFIIAPNPFLAVLFSGK